MFPPLAQIAGVDERVYFIVAVDIVDHMADIFVFLNFMRIFFIESNVDIGYRQRFDVFFLLSFHIFNSFLIQCDLLISDQRVALFRIILLTNIV